MPADLVIDLRAPDPTEHELREAGPAEPEASIRRRAVDATLTCIARHGLSKLTVDDVAIRRPTLDDVFLSLTGHQAEPERRGEAGGEALAETGVAA